MSDSSASSSTTKSTTPKTDNRVEFVGEGSEKWRSDQLPEDSHQPHLEPNPADTPPQTTKKGTMVQVAPVDPSPRSINMKMETVGDVRGGGMGGGVSSRPRSSRSRRHRRTHSEELYAMRNRPTPQPSQGYYPGAPVPYHMIPAKHESFDNGGHAPPRRNSAGHYRTNSLPQVPSVPSPNNMMVYPAPGYSPNGVPMLPQGNETGPLLPYTSASPSGSHRKRKSQAAAARAPASVMMMAPPQPGGHPSMYGSLEDYTEDLNVPPPPPPPSQPGYAGGDKFSPRGELMSLTGASPRTSRTPPGSPSMRKTGMKTPPQHPRTPRRSPPSANSFHTPLGGGYAAASRSIEADPRNVSFSPHTPIMQQRDGYPTSSGRSPYLSAGGADPNGNFNMNEYRDVHRGRKHRSPHSLRKMNMHQESAQLFMEHTKGVKQPVAFRDVLFGLLFIMHLVGIVYLGMHYSRDALMVNATHGELAINVWYRNVILIAALSGAFAVGVSTLTLILMTVIVKKLVQVSLILTIALSFAWGTIGIGVSPKNVVPITGIIALALSVGYAFIVWDRIPFAAANLMAGFHGVRKNAGTVLIAFCFQFLALVWSIYFTFVVIGVYDALLNGDLVLSKHATVFVYTMLFISFFWTYSVLYHVVQVTVAGTIGAWWFKPDSESSFCSPCVTQTFLQAVSFSFGSVCFGSLLVEPVRLIRQLSAFVRPAQDEYAHFGLLECFSWIQQCITGCVDNLAAYFTPYAFTYIGLYGYGLLEAGHDATDLFKKRGWMPIVSDDLIPNVLLMVSLVIGGVTGCFAVSIQQLDRLDISTLESPTVFAFVIGAVTGLVVTHVLFGLISSSVNAVIVLFAGSPVAFEENHPELSEELRSAWREVWPGCMDVVDIRVAQVTAQQQQQQQLEHNGTVTTAATGGSGGGNLPIV